MIKRISPSLAAWSLPYMTDSGLWNGDIWHELMALAPLTFDRDDG
jgi:hypothetical protein